MIENLEWHTEKRKVSDLIPWEKNPRQITKKQKDQLEKSLKKFNLMSIPVVDIDNKIISGHQRINLLGEIGRLEEEIDVRVPNRKLTEEEFKEYNLRSNRNIGDWDWELLALYEKDFLEGVGFGDDELEKIFKGEEDSDSKAEVEFTEELMEEHNFLVLYFDNEVDWLQARSLFDIKQVKALQSKENFQKIGIGRVLRGADAINKVKSELEKT